MSKKVLETALSHSDKHILKSNGKFVLVKYFDLIVSTLTEGSQLNYLSYGPAIT